MKSMKKLFVAVIAVVAAMALCVPALAFAAGDASITIKPQDNVPGTNTATYHYYELLHASISEDGSKVSYYLDNGTDDELRGLLDAVTVDDVDLFTFTQTADKTRWNATINKKADGTEYADSDGAKIAAALSTNAIKDAALDDGEFQMDTTTKKAVASDLEKGYYLVTSTLGTELVLQTLGDVTINTKNDAYTSSKTASKTNMNVGDIVTYTVKVDIPTTAIIGDVVTVHDTLDSHLAIKANTIAATFNNASVTLSDGTKKVETETFAKAFTVAAGMPGKSVYVTYDAELLSSAADPDTGFVNDAFANTSSYETVPTSVKVYTFDFDLKKNFTGETDDTLTATFKLYPQVKNTQGEGVQGTTPIQFVAIASTDNVTNYVKADSDDASPTDTIEAKNTKTLNINGLEAGTYYLVEQTTEDGFNMLAGPVVIVITDTSSNGTISHTVSVDGTLADVVVVNNEPGSVLPSTGGMGTTVLYVVGGIMIAVAVVFLVRRRFASKKSESEDLM